jgi:hypothetical protein
LLRVNQWSGLAAGGEQNCQAQGGGAVNGHRVTLS